MIHDACVEVTCDRESCDESVFVGLEWKYRSISESSGFYDSDDAAVEAKLRDDHDWIVSGDKHFCCEGHADIRG